MKTRWVSLVLGGLFGAVLIAALYFPILKRRVKQTAKPQPQIGRTGAQRIDATTGPQFERAAGEGQVVLGFERRRWFLFRR